MTLLVTGAAGFIGSHVAMALLDRGEQVVGIDNLNDYYDPALKHARIDRLKAAHGNAFEACRDSIGSYEVEARPGDGERYGPKKSVPIRGGSFFHPHGHARSAARLDVTLDYSDFNVGLRPARPIQP